VANACCAQCEGLAYYQLDIGGVRLLDRRACGLKSLRQNEGKK
jgi:hypothetical protein